MKLALNSLLITLGILIPTSTVLAEPPTHKTEELGLQVTQQVKPVPEFILTPDKPETVVIPESITRSQEILSKISPQLLIAEETSSSQVQEEETPTEAEETEETSSSQAQEEETPTEAEETEEQKPSPEEIARQQKFIEADRLYTSGQYSAAEQLYRQLKEPFAAEVEDKLEETPEAIHDPAQLSPAGAVYWRQSGQGLQQQLESKIFVPLKFLVEQYPEFIPGHLRYAQALKDYERKEEAIQALEQAVRLYPNQPDLLQALIETYDEEEKWLEASLSARQFALLNPDHPQAQEFTQLAEEHLERYKSDLRSELRGNAIANVITGALGYAFTGSLLGPFSALDSTVLLLRGESSVGESIANRAKEQLPLVEDEEVLEYVREIGNKLAAVTGRDDFEYEFYVIMDERLNAFALPGGKVFVNAGAIAKTDSEAELAGLLAHEISHAVLSHGFQLVTQGNLTANVTQFVPYGGTAANLIVLNYNRNMERQADQLGTRILASSGYAADGLRNLMVTLDQQKQQRPPFVWLSTHPDTDERIEKLEKAIIRNGYNRYVYEGVARHNKIKKRVSKLLKESKESEENRESQEKRK